MRKILLACLTICSIFTANVVTAQTFQTSDVDTIKKNSNGLTNIEIHNNIRATADSVKVTWLLDGYSFAPNMVNGGVCDNNICYTPAQLTAFGASFTTNWYKTNYGDFHVIFVDNGAANGSVSWMTVSMSSGATTRRLTFIVNKSATGITTTTVNEDNVSLYPNPARDFVNVLYDAKAGVKSIAVFNLIGKTMQVYKVTDDNSAKLDLGNIPSGVYFIRLMNAQGQVVATRRFTRQ